MFFVNIILDHYYVVKFMSVYISILMFFRGCVSVLEVEINKGNQS